MPLFKTLIFTGALQVIEDTNNTSVKCQANLCCVICILAACTMDHVVLAKTSQCFLFFDTVSYSSDLTDKGTNEQLRSATHKLPIKKVQLKAHFCN